ncbi:hypothetical protein PG994_013486 [Apiospora phragmitis]|uniref:Uncharacterized protein n=1 Tax=Apiospora phragmitis TaxID=2905665 RepID=A0ABR1T8R8_9PEZI
MWQETTLPWEIVKASLERTGSLVFSRIWSYVAGIWGGRSHLREPGHRAADGSHQQPVMVATKETRLTRQTVQEQDEDAIDRAVLNGIAVHD